MIKSFLFIGILFFTPIAAHAATCDAGYYLLNGECIYCTSPSGAYYCPGDDMRYPCPTTDTDYNQFGYILLPEHSREASWVQRPADSPNNCVCDLYFRDEYGNEFLHEASFNGTNYWRNTHYWHHAAPGFYLSPYLFTSNYNWYSGVKLCTNAPDNAHYTGAGTPDAPDGSVKDANDCPWECDDGYGLHDGECVPLCAADMRYIKTSNGLQFNLYPVVYSTPALHVKRGDTVCHAVLVPGAAKNSININHNGQIYHTAD